MRRSASAVLLVCVFCTAPLAERSIKPPEGALSWRIAGIALLAEGSAAVGVGTVLYLVHERLYEDSQQLVLLRFDRASTAALVIGGVLLGLSVPCFAKSSSRYRGSVIHMGLDNRGRAHMRLSLQMPSPMDNRVR
jgi:hypothetical protein